MDLLKLSLFSRIPLSDLILKHERELSIPVSMKSESGSTLSSEIEKDNRKKFVTLKVMVQKSSYKLLYALAGEDFLHFLCGVLLIPLGRIVSLFGSDNSLNCINSLYKSTSDLIDQKFFISSVIKDRLINLNLAYIGISSYQVLPLTQQLYVNNEYVYRPTNFPEGPGKFVKGPRMYKVADDLTVMPDCMFSIMSMLNGLNIPVSDITELELEIGEQEALRILKASLTSTCALTDVLTKDLMPKKQPKQEQ